jgi:riboflavin kinase/FMN adenylyltransferase
MQIIEWPAFTGMRTPAAMTIGVFDGVHLGHQALIKRVVDRGPNPTVITFRKNPKKLLSPGNFEGDIFNLEQKLAAFDSLGVNQVILIDFSEKFCRLSGGEFFDILAEKGGMVFLAIGLDFRCGFHRETDTNSIREMNERKGIPTEVIPAVELPDALGGGPISSSRLRSAILSGDHKLAAALMGHSFEFFNKNPTGVE